MPGPLGRVGCRHRELYDNVFSADAKLSFLQTFASRGRFRGSREQTHGRQITGLDVALSLLVQVDFAIIGKECLLDVTMLNPKMDSVAVVDHDSIC